MTRTRVHRPTRAVLGLLLTAAACSAGALSPALASAGTVLPAVKHVWVIELENQGFDQAFGSANAANTYLYKTLPSQGQLLRNYYGTGHFSLDNYISQLSGQAPNPDTQADCQTYQDFVPGTPTTDGQVVGAGCVYPAAVKTLASQLDDKGLTWHGYMQDMGNTPSREEASCGRPVSAGPVPAAGTVLTGAPGANGRDSTQSATAADQYAARHNPFIYFHSITDDVAKCQQRVTPLTPAGFAGDLATAASTPAFSFITPNLCDDAHDTNCAGNGSDGTKAGGLKAADAFLKTYVPLIQASPAYADGGLIVVTLDESGNGDSTACCNEPTGPNTTTPGQQGPGGGRIGTVLLSPFIQPGTVNDTFYNHYGFLRSMEDLFGITTGGSDGKGHLGYAGTNTSATGAANPQVVPFGADVFNATPTPPPGLPDVARPALLGVGGAALLTAVVLLRRRRAA